MWASDPNRGEATTINWRDFLERVGWTAIYTILATGLTALTTDDITWQAAARLIGIAVLAAVLKVMTAQQVGTRGSGDAFPGGTVERR